MGTNILELTTKCRTSLVECQNVELLMEADWARICLEEFDRWAVNVWATTRSVSHASNSCLGELESRINYLLWTLIKRLAECIELAKPAPKSDKASRHILGTLPQKMKEVDEFLDDLVHVPVDMERMETRSRQGASNVHFKLEDHLDLRAHLIAVMLSRRYISEKGTVPPENIDPTSLSVVQLRIVDCNLKRRHQRQYMQNYFKTSDTQSDENLHEDRKGKRASVVTSSFQLPRIPAPSQAVAAQLPTTVMRLDYHHPPQLQDAKSLFDCPCCFQTFPASLLEEDQWKEHLEGDLSPYPCIIPSCPMKSVIFPSKEEWMEHLNRDHENDDYWVCKDCLDCPEFHTEELFDAHISKYHCMHNRRDIPRLMFESGRPFPIQLTSCPMCAWPTAKDGKVTKRELINHIAEELRSFSLRSLPWSPYEDHEDAEQIDRIAAEVRDWLTKNNLPTDIFQIPPGLNYA